MQCKTLSLLGLILCIMLPVQAKDKNNQEQVSLGEIVIGPLSNIKATSVYTSPYPAQVYTEDDIKDTGSATLLEFFKKKSAVNVSDWYGTSVKANVDLMGFGDNASSNLLVLVNGRRINDIDMSGIDWTQIPVDNIERVEIIKGAGAVLYGDNTAGGVINIITKKARPSSIETSLSYEGGSYSFNKESLTTSGGKELLNFYLYAEHHSTNGYRENSHYRSKFANINIRSKINEDTNLSLDSGHHEYVYGLPGALYDNEIGNTYSRRDSKYPLDNASMEDNYLSLNIEKAHTHNIKGVLDISYRNKNGLDELLTWSSITDKNINTLTIKPQLYMNTSILNRENTIITGLEFYKSDLSADSTSYTDINRRSEAFFIQDTIKLNPDLSLNLGLRTEKEEFTFNYYSSFSSTDDDLDFWENSYQAGINYTLNEKTNFFTNFSRGFRVPKTDEYLITWPSASVNKDLLPQTSKTFTSGMNSRLNKSTRLYFDVFYLKIDEEIYYNPLTYSNANYDKTQRTGFNLKLNYAPIEELSFSAGYRFIDAKFKDGSFQDKTIPAVPKHKFTLSAQYDFWKYWRLFADTQYRDSVYLINDLNNQLPQLDRYWIANMKLSFKKNDFEIFAGINNILDRKYSEYASTNSTATVRALYPSPERNFFWGSKISF